MGNVNGGYFVGQWALAAFFIAALLPIASVVGMFGAGWSRWSTVSSVLFAAYAVWTFVSLIWSPNRGSAWIGAGQTSLYLLVFLATIAFTAQGAPRRWIFTTAALGPAMVAAFTIPALIPSVDELFTNSRLIGTVGYYNGEAAILLVPFWMTIYVSGSPRVNPVLRGLVLAGTVLCVAVAVLAQSRGAVVAMALSLPVFFLFSG